MDPKTGNREWRDLVTVLRCGIGNNFDIDKLYFNRINILTDQDVDGFNITSGILAFFYKYLPEIIEKGYLYKVYTPLYALNDKNTPFVRNKRELVENYHKKISKIYKIKPVDDAKYFTKSEFKEFLNDTYDYSTNLTLHAKDIGHVNKFLLEQIIAYMVIGGVINSEKEISNDDLDKVFSDQKFIKYLLSRIQIKFKEITIKPESRIITGIIDGKRYSIKINERLIRKVRDLIPVYEKYGYTLSVVENNKEPVIISIGEFLDSAMKYYPKINTRFKGLGEINGEHLYETALDINNRISIQYTMEDAERELAIFNKVHGPGKHDAALRKEMMSNYKIRRDDLDN